MVERTCSVCGELFMAHASEVRRRGGKYCSRACLYAAQKGAGAVNWRGGQVACVCLTCGKTFYVDPYRVRAGEAKYCTKECYWARVRGEKHWKYRHGRGQFPYTGGFGKSVREKVITRDKVCIDCGSWDPRPRRMQVHHLDGGYTDHSLDNLVLLCIGCHMNRHHSNSRGKRTSRVVSSARAIAS